DGAAAVNQFMVTGWCRRKKQPITARQAHRSAASPDSPRTRTAGVVATGEERRIARWEARRSTNGMAAREIMEKIERVATRSETVSALSPTDSPTTGMYAVMRSNPVTTMRAAKMEETSRAHVRSPGTDAARLPCCPLLPRN